MDLVTVWSRIASAGPAVVVLVAASVALLAFPVLRRLAPRNRRHRGGPARLSLGLAVLLGAGAVAVGTMGAASPGNILQLVGLLALVLGLVGMGGLLVFDVVLPRVRIDVPSIVRDLVLVTIGVAITMGFLRLAGLDVFSLVTTSAVLTAIIGLALQATIANVFSGLGLQLDRTLRHGEWIEVGGRVGRILEIGWRSTRIQTEDGDTAFVPNSELVSKEVLNFARPVGAHRTTVRVGFHYRHPPNEVRRVLLGAIRDVPGVAADPAPQCGPTAFGDSSVVYALRYWIRDFAHDTAIKEEVHTRVWYAARRAGLEIPYPTRTVVSERSVAAARTSAEGEGRRDALQRLAASEPFSRLDAEGREGCANGIRRLEFARGEVVLHAGDPGSGLQVIDSGEVTVRRRIDGTRQTVAMLGVGDLLGHRLLAGADDEYVAHSDVILYELEDRALEAVLTGVPELDAKLSAIAAARQGALAGPSDPSSPANGHVGSPRSGRLVPSFRELFVRR